jgi:hypothetical protein
VPYFHVVFTLPHQLNPLCQRNPRLLYDLLFRASAQTMLEVAANPKHLGAKIGFLSILHTWGKNLRLHPHLHCVVPAGGFEPGYSRWVHLKYPFFLPVKVLSPSTSTQAKVKRPPNLVIPSEAEGPAMRPSTSTQAKVKRHPPPCSGP